MSFATVRYADYTTFFSKINPGSNYWDTEIQSHTTEELLLLVSPGSCTIRSNGETFQVPTPAFIWNRAGSYHLITGQSIVGEPSYTANFPTKLLTDTPKELQFFRFIGENAVFALPLSESRLQRLKALFGVLIDSPLHQRAPLLACIFHQVSQALAAGLEPIRFGNINDYIFQVIKLLQEVGPERLTTDSLAARFHVGKTKLNDDFKRIANVSVHAYRLEQQLRAARTKLASSKAPIVQIAIDCGFTDESHLIRAFRTRYGITPGAFRKKYMADFRIVQQHTQEYPSTT